MELITLYVLIEILAIVVTIIGILVHLKSLTADYYYN